MSYSAISKTDFKYQKYYAEELFQKENIFFCVQNILSSQIIIKFKKKKNDFEAYMTVNSISMWLWWS